MGNTISVQQYNFDKINSYELSDIWEQFEKDSPCINDKQRDLLYKLVPNNEERKNLYRQFNVEDEYYLKPYMLDLITKYEYNISVIDKQMLLFYFNDDIYDKISALFPQYNEYIIEKIEYENDEYSNDEQKLNTIKIRYLLQMIKRKDMKIIYKQYPQLNIVNSKNKNFVLRSIDYPTEYNHMYEYGYQQRYIDNELTNKRLYYVRFYDWCCFDLDNNNSFEELNEMLTKVVNDITESVFCLYKTTNGFHIHIMNKLISYNSVEYKVLSNSFKSDIWYYIFTNSNGYKLRLNKKNDDEEYVAKFVKYYRGKNGKINDDCFYYKGIYDNYLNKHTIMNI